MRLIGRLQKLEKARDAWITRYVEGLSNEELATMLRDIYLDDIERRGRASVEREVAGYGEDWLLADDWREQIDKRLQPRRPR